MTTRDTMKPFSWAEEKFHESPVRSLLRYLFASFPPKEKEGLNNAQEMLQVKPTSSYKRRKNERNNMHTQKTPRRQAKNARKQPARTSSDTSATEKTKFPRVTELESSHF